MEEVIKQIIDIEDKAQSIIDEAIKDKKTREQEHKARIEELEDAIVEDARRKVAQIREREFNEIKEAEEAKVRRCDERLVQMDAYAKENMEQWVEDLVKRVLD